MFIDASNFGVNLESIEENLGVHLMWPILGHSSKHLGHIEIYGQ